MSALIESGCWLLISTAKLMTVLLVLMSGPSSFAARLYFVDLDGTWFNDQGAWVTYWEFVRADLAGGLQIPMAKELNLPERIHLSRAERDQWVTKFALEDRLPGDQSAVELFQDPLMPMIKAEYEVPVLGPNGQQMADDGGNPVVVNEIVRPEKAYLGYYRVDPYTTFRFHRDGNSGGHPAGFSPAIVDAKIAIERSRLNPELTVLGKAHKHIENALRNMGPDDRIVVITDRWHDEASLRTVLKMFLEAGLFHPDITEEHLSPIEFAFMNDYENRAMQANAKRRKSGYIVDAVKRMVRSSDARHDFYSPRDGDTELNHKINGHQVIVFENDNAYLSNIASELMTQAGMHTDIGFMLYNAAPREAVQASSVFNPAKLSKPVSRFVVLNPYDQHFRKILPKERELLRKPPISCATSLASRPRREKF